MMLFQLSNLQWETYSHVTPDLEEAAARQIDEVLNLTLAESSSPFCDQNGNFTVGGIL